MASASFGGTNYTLKNIPKVGTWPNAAQCNAELYCLSEECLATGAHAAGTQLMMGKLPAGAIVQFTAIWPIDSDEYFDGAAAMNAAVTGELGTLTDNDLFGVATALNVAALQIIEPVPDGTTYTSTLDLALRSETIIVFTTADQSMAATEGIAIKMFYTLAGKTYT